MLSINLKNLFWIAIIGIGSLLGQSSLAFTYFYCHVNSQYPGVMMIDSGHGNMDSPHLQPDYTIMGAPYLLFFQPNIKNNWVISYHFDFTKKLKNSGQQELACYGIQPISPKESAPLSLGGVLFDRVEIIALEKKTKDSVLSYSCRESEVYYSTEYYFNDVQKNSISSQNRIIFESSSNPKDHFICGQAETD